MIVFSLFVWSILGLLAFGYTCPDEAVGWTTAQIIFVLSLYGPVLWLIMLGYGIWTLLGYKPAVKNEEPPK